MRSVFAANSTISAALKKFTLQLVTPAVTKVGWEFRPHEDYLTAQLRPLLIETAGLAGNQDIMTEANRQFNAFMSPSPENPTLSAVHPSLRRSVFKLACTTDSVGVYPKIQEYYLHTTSIDGKEMCLISLGRVQTTDLARQFFIFLLSPEVATQDIHSGATALGANKPEIRQELWNCIKEYWTQRPLGEVADVPPLPEAQGTDAGAGGHKIAGGASHASVLEKAGTNRGVVLSRFLRMGLSKFSDAGVAKDIESFFSDKNPAELGCDRDLGVIKDTVFARDGYRKRDQNVVEEWLSAKGYA